MFLQRDCKLNNINLRMISKFLVAGDLPSTLYKKQKEQNDNVFCNFKIFYLFIDVYVSRYNVHAI